MSDLLMLLALSWSEVDSCDFSLCYLSPNLPKALSPGRPYIFVAFVGSFEARENLKIVWTINMVLRIYDD